MSDAPHTLADAVEKLVGSVLSSVVFVEDYVQFGFNGPGLTAYTAPTIAWGSEFRSWDQPGYRDALCKQIGRGVERTAVDKEQLSIVFQGGASISISLRDKDYCGPKALQFSLDSNCNWVV